MLEIDLDDYVKGMLQKHNWGLSIHTKGEEYMSLEQLTQEIRGKVTGGGIEESIKFDLGADGAIFIKGSDVTNDNNDADCTIIMAADDLADMLSGDLDPTAAFMGGKMQVEGDMSLAMKLGSIV